MSQQPIRFTDLLNAFQMFDENKDGSISVSEFRSVCQKLNMNIEEKKIRELFENCQSISFDKFCSVMQYHSGYSTDSYFQETFRAFDRNSDGFITPKEIKKTMKILGEPLSKKQAKEMVRAADVNGDGKLSETEFRSIFNLIAQTNANPPISPVSTTPTGSANERQTNPFQP